mmetsp:Transcript_22348/g.62704  ORF Transcript_22348/g.62704 Transcript_22348/m.62704 type:complete len:283 (-) Transcript_22348:832-1680(-)
MRADAGHSGCRGRVRGEPGDAGPGGGAAGQRWRGQAAVARPVPQPSDPGAGGVAAGRRWQRQGAAAPCPEDAAEEVLRHLPGAHPQHPGVQGPSPHAVRDPGRGPQLLFRGVLRRGYHRAHDIHDRPNGQLLRLAAGRRRLRRGRVRLRAHLLRGACHEAVRGRVADLLWSQPKVEPVGLAPDTHRGYRHHLGHGGPRRRGPDHGPERDPHAPAAEDAPPAQSLRDVERHAAATARPRLVRRRPRRGRPHRLPLLPDRRHLLRAGRQPLHPGVQGRAVRRAT